MNPKKLTVEQALKMSKMIDSETPLLDAQVLLCEVTGLSKVGLYTQNKRVLTDEEYERYTEFIKRRQKNEPIAYITGHCEFMGLDFEVDSSTLIPRPDTEILTEILINICREKSFETVLDICTGSGAIGICTAKFTTARVTATDISPNALSKAEENARKNDVRISLIRSDMFENISGKFDAIVSNPPYIRTDIIPTLDSNVKDYEPITALDGGEDGLRFYRQIAENSHKHINKGGMLFFEIGYDQADAVKKIMEENDFEDITLLKDYSGLDRVLYAVMK